VVKGQQALSWALGAGRRKIHGQVVHPDRRRTEGNDHFRHAINIGSVGKPKDKDPRGGYVILTINPDSALNNKDSIQVEFIRFDYDIEKAAKAVEDSPLPNGYAEMLRKG
jgi:hypothetical protein